MWMYVAMAAAGFLGYEVWKKEAGGTKIAPPGAKQPPGPITIPKIGPVTDSLHASAAAAVQYLTTNAPNTSAVPQVKAFQNAFNIANPGTNLAEDGKYGAKTQAALQAVITPAVAPGNWYPSSASVPGPAVPAPAPTPNVDVQTAAAALTSMGVIPKAPDARVTTFQASYNLHNPTTHLVQDGKYGPLSQAALQSVLDYEGGGGQAPRNPYGGVPTTIPSFPG